MKKYILPFLMMTVLTVGFSSCKKDDQGAVAYSYVSLDSAPAEFITPVSAILNAEIRFVNMSGGKMFLSFFYSDQKFDRYSLEEATRTDIVEFDAKDGKYPIGISNLKPNTTYYYIPYLSVAGVTLVDKVLSFNTMNFCMTEEPTLVETTTATLNAMAFLTAQEQASCTWGFEWTKEDFDRGEVKQGVGGPLDEEGNYSLAIDSLDPNTQYWVRAYVSRNGRREYGDIKDFKTKSE
ncbi:MAG: hypothetical protein K5651_06775 [Bacteroidales bacterium]|nr:hypothetical protein [Bacteroidales bacterium]